MADEPSAAPPTKKPRGCLFYAAVAAGVLALGSVLATVFLAFAVRRMIISHTAAAPLALPPTAISEADYDGLKRRVEAFKSGLAQAQESPELVLSADEINALIARESRPADGLKDILRVTIDGDKIGGRLSLPLGKTKLPLPAGRYLNAAASFQVSMDDGVLIVTADSVELDGKPLPDRVMAALRKENLAKDAYRRANSAEMLRRIESIKVKDGRLSIKPRAGG